MKLRKGMTISPGGCRAAEIPEENKSLDTIRDRARFPDWLKKYDQGK